MQVLLLNSSHYKGSHSVIILLDYRAIMVDYSEILPDSLLNDDVCTPDISR